MMLAVLIGLGVLVLIILVIIYMVYKKRDSASPPSAPGAPAPPPNVPSIPAPPPPPKQPVVQKFDIPNLSSASSVFDERIITTFTENVGNLLSIKFEGRTKEQGWGNRCAALDIAIRRNGVNLYVNSINMADQENRNDFYNRVSLVEVKDISVAAGDQLVVTAKAYWSGCRAIVEEGKLELTFL